MPAEHNEEVEKQYFEYILKVYKSRKDDWHGEILKEYFVEDFQDFSLEMFRNMPRERHRYLRQHLSKNGVYVPIGVGIHFATVLFEVLTRNLTKTFPISLQTEKQRTRSMQKAQASLINPLVDRLKQVTALADYTSQLSSINCIDVQENGQANNTR